MYQVSEIYADKIIENGRQFAVRLTFGSTTILTGATIQDITLDEVVNSSDTLTLGCACSNKITVNLINPPTDIDYDGASFKAEVGLLLTDRPVNYEYVPLGFFYSTTPETNNDFKNLKLTAYDGFCKMTDKYMPNVLGEVTLQQVYNDLRTQLHDKCGVVLVERTLPEYTISDFPILDITYTQAIGYVAGCLGGFARFNRDGELEISNYNGTTQIITRDLQYMNGFERTTKNPLSITSIATGTQEHPIVRGDGVNGTQINFENPYITDAMADDIFNIVSEYQYTPNKTKWRGNPAMQAGDIVNVIDKDDITHKVFVMSQQIKISGGCTHTIESKGQNQTESAFSNNYETTTQKINRVYTTLEQKILDATNSITGNSGGYVVLNDTNNDGKPDEILIMDYEEIPLATKVWRWNKEGLGYSYNPNGNAYNGSFRTAITADGQIVADFITSGTMSAERIAVENFSATNPTILTDYIRFGEGTITLGKGDSAITLKLENNKIAFYSGETPIAWFTNNSFEIENITSGKIRFQNFAFIPRASGNLTFTKVS